MAEGKTVNVKIQYNVDSAQVQKAEQLLKQANQASNQFQASAQKLGQSTSQAFNTAGQSIETLRAKLISLKERITVASDPTKIKQLSDEYTRLKAELDKVTNAAFRQDKAIKQAAANATKALKEQEKASKAAAKAAEDAAKSKSIESLANQFGQLATAAKLFLTAGIVREAVNVTLEMAKLAGNVEGVERAFNRSFPNSVALLTNLRNATHGTITDFELMQRTLQATNLGVAVEQLPILFEFAATRAQQTGESVDYLVDSIVRGIGRKSILVLDNLGLSATRLREQFNGASLASQSVGEVTKGVAEIARVELQKMGGYAETSATKVDQLTVALQELRVEASKKAETSGFVQLLTDAANGIRLFLKGNQELVIERAKLLASQEAERVIQSKAFKELGGDQQKKLDFIQQEMNTRQQLIGVYNDEIKKANELIKAFNGLKTPSLSDNAAGLKHLTQLQQQYGDKALEVFNKEVQQAKTTLQFRLANRLEIRETIKVLGEYLAELQKINTVETPGLIEDLQNRIEALGDSIKKAKTEGEIAKLNTQLVILEFRLRELQELGKTQINPLASLIYDLKNFPKLDLKTALPTSEDIAKDTEDLTTELAGKMKEKMGKVGKASAEGFIDHFKVELQGREEEILTTGIDIFSEQLVSFETAELASLQNRLNNLRNFYDEQMILAGDNDAAKERLRLKEEQQSAALQKRIAEQERKARKFSIIIDTAAGIAKAFATSRTIYEGIINAALVAAQGASQLAIVNRTPARFAKGGLNIQGPGTGTSDSIDARISKGESVMTANEWKTSKNVLKEVRAKTLDDKVLSDLKLTRDGVKYVGMDDKNIVKEIRDLKNSFPDVEARGNLQKPSQH